MEEARAEPFADQLPELVALTLSGGGYRAAAFHLGSLEYLFEIGLGERIAWMSTVSGGSILGAAWLIAAADGTRFPDFARQFRKKLLDIDLVRDGLAALSGPAPAIPSARHDLITGMAALYAKHFFAHRDGSPWRMRELQATKLAIREVAINATEFRFGLSFRFVRSDSDQVIHGNQKLRVSAAAAGDIRLADAVAASSCFPAGFEPLQFPDDFAWSTANSLETARTDVARDVDGKPSYPALMDGGIYDNQGIESLMGIADRVGREPDLFVISDVSLPPDDVWDFPNQPISRRGPKLRTVVGLMIALATGCLVSFASLVATGISHWHAGTWRWPALFTIVLPALLCLAVGYLFWWAYACVRDEGLSKVPRLGDRSWFLLRKLSLRQLIAMLSLRIRSSLVLTTTIFMSRIRRLGYQRVFGDARYAQSRVSNLIYELTSGRPWPKELDGLVLPPSQALRDLADRASSMPTTLWFDVAEQCDDLIALGRATIIPALMAWLVRRHGRDPQRFPPALKTLWDRLLTDWDNLRARLPDGNLTTPQPLG
ncbi:MAG: patatin-like phospholipase family protein [Planctomycetota bacterium]